MMETVKSYNNVPKRSNIGSSKSMRLPMVPRASSLLLGGASVVTALDEFCAATIISRPQPAIYSMFKHSARQASSDQEATSDVHEVCHGQPSKKKRLSNEQVKFLESSFDLESKLEPERKKQLANELGLQPRQVAVWYQNKRARSKTKQLEHKYGVLKLQFQAVVAEKQQLELEVFKLRELLGLQEEKIPIIAEVKMSVGKEEAVGVSKKHEKVGATVETEQRFSKELKQQIKEGEKAEEEEEEGEGEGEGEETAVDTEAESVELSCSGTGLSEALDANSPASNNYDRPQNTSELTQIMSSFIDQSNFSIDQMLLSQQEHHVLYQPHQQIWTNYHQLGSVKLEHNDSAYLVNSNYPFSLEDDMDSFDFKFVACG